MIYFLYWNIIEDGCMSKSRGYHSRNWWFLDGLKEIPCMDTTGCHPYTIRTDIYYIWYDMTIMGTYDLLSTSYSKWFPRIGRQVDRYHHEWKVQSSVMYAHYLASLYSLHFAKHPFTTHCWPLTKSDLSILSGDPKTKPKRLNPLWKTYDARPKLAGSRLPLLNKPPFGDFSQLFISQNPFIKNCMHHTVAKTGWIKVSLEIKDPYEQKIVDAEEEWDNSNVIWC